ncbi:phosphotransferase-like protein [Nocardioides sp.]|uniref:phosphotransferase-like protein n=1 Tax=Nocardioides sp. TaxID=35761 RepID=UPI002ED8FB8A
MTTDRPGRVVLLNGPSSSGRAASPERCWDSCPTRLGYHRAVSALASAGNDVVMDYPLSEPWRLADLLDVLGGYDVTLVDVRCPPAELDRRERSRGDRPTGLARSQTQVYAHGDRDIEVDSGADSAESCARVIVDTMDSLPSPKAFDRLRAGRG